jgi:hypothetical protein
VLIVSHHREGMCLAGRVVWLRRGRIEEGAAVEPLRVQRAPLAPSQAAPPRAAGGSPA